MKSRVIGVCGLLGFLLAPCAAFAQRMVEPATERGKVLAARLAQELDEAPRKNTLNCSVSPLNPELNFAFRYQAGYRVSLPINQFSEELTRIRVAFRVTPAGASDPRYFRQEFWLGAGPRSRRLQAAVSGGFFIGEGEYRVDWVLSDAGGRTCSKSWRVRLRLNDGERSRVNSIKPGEVAPLLISPLAETDEWAERPYRAAIFLHASPLRPRSVHLSSYDQSLLLTLLSSLVEKTPLRVVSVRAISLHRQKEILQTETLNRTTFSDLQKAMDELDLGTVDMEQLSNPKGEVDMLARLVNEELASHQPPDAIIFVGPNSTFDANFPEAKIQAAGAMPLFFYLRLERSPLRYTFADTIEKLTKRGDGRVFRIYNPRDLAGAIERMERMLSSRIPPRSTS